ncbi:hypothetical protein GN244_ATG09839 [Phytophthora infestans]|uniref:Uncharacterized protein n=1 Tax=Phytophthora infestans TaxID=4787 RepID=A0A833T646_PHYIN|nr:hypothetical protein GN244_ATG09839 [Phytophthora infestans]KAF4145341.1 hypothetical protein GN958_ATG05530 [Phytophthora infestans]
MKVVSAFAAAALALLGAVHAVDVDNGFTQDGSTTYCMGVNGAVGTLNFDSLEAGNVGRCPVGVTLTLTASEIHMGDPVTVKWSAKANVGLANAIFPNAIDATTGLPGAVTTSSLFACTAGTNCATNVGGTPTGADGTSTGAFAADGTKALETNTFNLASAGDYIIVGIVALPGDASLNLAAEEYIVFKKISIVSADSAISSSSTSNTGSVGTSDDSSGTEETTWSTTAPPVTTAPPLTQAPSLSTGSSASSSGSNNTTTTSAPGSTSGNDSGSSAEQGSEEKQSSGEDESAQLTDSSTKTTKAPTTSDDTTQQSDPESSGATKTASTSTGSGGFLGDNGVIIIAALVGCCIVGVVGFAFVMRRRKEQRMHANKAFDLNSPSMSSDMDDSGLHGHDGKIDLTYVANISSRNNNKAAENMMSEESSVAIMASAERGSELNSSNGSSLHSLPKSSLDTDEYSEKASYGAAGAAAAAAHSNEAEIDAYRMSNMSEISSIAGTQSEASMSNFGDSVVSARQNKYLQPGDWNDSESSRMDSRLDSMEQAELKARGFGSIGGFSTVSGLSEDDTSRITGMSDHDSNRNIGFSMSSCPTVESRFTEDFNVQEDRATVESRFDDYRATEESRVTEDSRATGFSVDMGQSRLQSEVSVDSYGFRASRSSADSYSSGMSPYSRESSRISGFSVASSDRSSNASKY